jgi:hypothetical protein
LVPHPRAEDRTPRTRLGHAPQRQRGRAVD